MICDQEYTSKSNSRSGGAGIEAQIITPELYSKSAQDKFVAVVRGLDTDGKASIPTYYKGRIFIDLSDAAAYSEEYEKLIRWAWDQPVYVKPELGEKPKFLREENFSVKLQTSVQFRRAIDCIRNDRSAVVQATKEFFEELSSEMIKLPIEYTSDKFDDCVIKSIGEFLPYRNDVVELSMTIASYRRDDVEMVEAIHRFFEKILSFLYMPAGNIRWNDDSVDNFRFIAYELFLCLIGSFIKYERFSTATYFINTEYYAIDRLKPDTLMHPFIDFCQHTRTLENRN